MTIHNKLHGLVDRIVGLPGLLDWIFFVIFLASLTWLYIQLACMSFLLVEDDLYVVFCMELVVARYIDTPFFVDCLEP